MAPQGNSSDSADNTAKDEETSESEVDEMLQKLTPADFEEWYQQRKFAQNIQEGKPYFNGPSSVPDPERHSPSQLMQCHRKRFYHQLNAPEEDSDPEGIYWFGSKFENEIILPYLREAIADSEEYVRNSIWVDFTVASDVGELQFRGSTDPVFVDTESRPLLLSEVKTTSAASFKHIDAPITRHKAQVHTYMYGLTQKYERTLTDSIVIYGNRDDFSLKVFHVEFDQEFWINRILQWARNHTQYRTKGELPPAEPEQDHECNYCSYRNRCGQGDTNHGDLGTKGFLPLFAEYPHAKVEEYLEANKDADAKLTPTLAHYYQDLVTKYGVHDWQCVSCGATHRWDTIDWDGNVDNPPLCPQCKNDGIPAPLSGPSPTEQVSVMEKPE